MPAKQQGTLTKRGDSWQARWFDHEGKRQSELGFPSKSAGRAFLRVQIAEAEQVRRGHRPPESDRPATVDDLLDMFLEKHGRLIDPGTRRTLEVRLRHARAEFGPVAPDRLRKAEIEDWRTGLRGSVQHDAFRSFRQALAWAADPGRGLLERNPSDGIRNPRPKRHERRPVFPFESWAEVETLCEELDPRYRAIPIVGVGTGLRPEELFGLHRADVDRDRMRLHVHRRYTQRVVKQGTKTGGERYVPFGQRVLAALEAMPARIDTPVLFPAPRGGYIDVEKLRHRDWAPALRAAGLPHHRIYDMRHTFASWMLAQDVPPAKLALMMGTSIAQLEDTYHRFLKSDDRYGAALDSYVGTAAGAER
jgi:integrase